MYIYNTKIRLFHTDAANLIFFSNLFNLAHECYEEFLEESGFSIKKILNDNIFLIPIVHAEADYLKPLRVGDKIEIRMSLNSLGKSSFTLDFVLYDKSGEKTAAVKTVNVVIETKSKRSLEIPEKFFEILKNLNI